MILPTILLPDGREVALIHYAPGDKLACMPNMLAKDMCANKEREAPMLRTDAHSGVTCPMCKRSSVWVEASKR